MNHVFISYCREDRKFAKGCQIRLAENHLTAWRDDSIPGGEDWRSQIDNAIKEAFALIVVITPASKRSEYVTYEWAYAWGAGVKVIPLLLKKTEVHPRLASLQYLDFTRRIRPWERLIDLLREAKESKPQGPKITRQLPVPIKDPTRKRAYDKMIEALRDEKWTWRTIKRLASIGGLPEKVALDVLASDPNIEFSRGDKGQKLAKLNMR